MTHKLTCKIRQKTLSFDIEIERGLLKNVEKHARYLSSLGSRCAIIADEHVSRLYGDELVNALSRHSEVHLFSFPAGEKSKTRQMKELIENQMFEKELGRDTCLIAFGGGVATDMGGFIASTYCRGIPLVAIPTSLLAMVDASMGGKTGVDVAHGKNLIGTIYQPKKILIDPDLLTTLPIHELRNGIVEMIKHAIIADEAYFDDLNTLAHEILAFDTETIEMAIEPSCRIKMSIVMQDEKEIGKRHLLNFGHTIGHALENASNYSLSHGEAVAIGMLVESFMACELGYLNSAAFDRIKNILMLYGLPLRLPQMNVQAILASMKLDKKSLKGMPRFVMMEEIGFPLPCGRAYCKQVEKNTLDKALNWMIHDLCCH